LALLLVVLATLAGAYLFYRAMPAYSGAERLAGLSSEARVWRDAYGVPHIFASSMDNAARALGYLHASERMFQMDILRRVGQGRMAEIRGADLLPVDQFIRTVGFYREAETSLSALSPWAQKRLEAYAEGVNAFLASHALPPEFLLDVSFNFTVRFHDRLQLKLFNSISVAPATRWAEHTSNLRLGSPAAMTVINF